MDPGSESSRSHDLPGTTEGSGVNRPVLFCRACKPICPQCGKTLPRLQIDTGSIFTICGAKSARSGSRRGPDEGRCGQRLHILGTGRGVCIVMTLTTEEYLQYTQAPYSIEEMYEDLQVLAA